MVLDWERSYTFLVVPIVQKGPGHMRLGPNFIQIDEEETFWILLIECL